MTSVFSVGKKQCTVFSVISTEVSSVTYMSVCDT